LIRAPKKQKNSAEKPTTDKGKAKPVQDKNLHTVEH